MRLHVALALTLLGSLAHAGIAHADCTEAGACASNEYCAIDDGGVVVTDGGAGVCVAEPCVVASDCANGDLCDTSQQPFKCVQCISSADCNDLYCDPATRTCINYPPDSGFYDDGGPSVDASVDTGVVLDASVAVDATAPVTTSDASAPPPSEDASDDATLADAGPYLSGSLTGGGCDCGLTGPTHASGAGFGAFGASFALALSLIARRRKRR